MGSHYSNNGHGRPYFSNPRPQKYRNGDFFSNFRDFAEINTPAKPSYSQYIVVYINKNSTKYDENDHPVTSKSITKPKNIFEQLVLLDQGGGSGGENDEDDNDDDGGSSSYDDEIKNSEEQKKISHHKQKLELYKQEKSNKKNSKLEEKLKNSTTATTTTTGKVSSKPPLTRLEIKTDEGIHKKIIFGNDEEVEEDEDDDENNYKINSNNKLKMKNVNLMVTEKFQEENFFENLSEPNPMITFNHVCSEEQSEKVNYDEIRFKNSRSSSPMLEVPGTKKEEKITTRPPL